MNRCVLLLAFFCPVLGLATTKGLNQIVTPDIQPFGQLSISYQMQNAAIGNPYQIQYEYGITKNFEAAVFQGLDPGLFSGAMEYGIVQKPNFLLSVGFLGWSNRGDEPQPFVESGFIKGNGRVIFGLQRIGRATDGVAGVAYQTTPTVLLQADYLGGKGNFLTAGFTYSPTGNLSINPALYFDDTNRVRTLPYIVVSYTIALHKSK